MTSLYLLSQQVAGLRFYVAIKLENQALRTVSGKYRKLTRREKKRIKSWSWALIQDVELHIERFPIQILLSDPSLTAFFYLFDVDKVNISFWGLMSKVTNFREIMLFIVFYCEPFPQTEGAYCFLKFFFIDA